MPQMFLDRTVPITLDEILLAEGTAVLVVDAQNDFCSVGGRSHGRGTDISEIVAVLPHIHALLETARACGVAVIYIQNTVFATGVLNGLPDLARRIGAWGRDNPLVTLSGSWGHAIVDVLAPHPGDLVVQKFRQSGFVGTNLEMVLRANGWRAVLVCGVETHACVEATARDAMGRDFAVVLVEDCVAAAKRSLHDASLTVMRALLPQGWVTDLATVQSVLAGAQAPTRERAAVARQNQ